MSDAPLASSSGKRIADQAEDGFEDVEDGNGNKRRRMRYRVACLPCQRKKCKCGYRRIALLLSLMLPKVDVPLLFRRWWGSLLVVST